MGRRLASGVVTLLPGPSAGQIVGGSPTGRTVSGRGAAPAQGKSWQRTIPRPAASPAALGPRASGPRAVGAQSAGRSSTREWARLVNPAARAGDGPEPAAAAACSAYLRATTTESPMAPDSAT